MNQILVALGSDTSAHRGGLARIVIGSGSSVLCARGGQVTCYVITTISGPPGMHRTPP